MQKQIKINNYTTPNKAHIRPSRSPDARAYQQLTNFRHTNKSFARFKSYCYRHELPLVAGALNHLSKDILQDDPDFLNTLLAQSTTIHETAQVLIAVYLKNEEFPMFAPPTPHFDKAKRLAYEIYKSLVDKSSFQEELKYLRKDIYEHTSVQRQLNQKWL